MKATIPACSRKLPKRAPLRHPTGSGEERAAGVAAEVARLGHVGPGRARTLGVPAVEGHLWCHGVGATADAPARGPVPQGSGVLVRHGLTVRDAAWSEGAAVPPHLGQPTIDDPTQRRAVRLHGIDSALGASGEVFAIGAAAADAVGSNGRRQAARRDGWGRLLLHSLEDVAELIRVIQILRSRKDKVRDDRPEAERGEGR